MNPKPIPPRMPNPFVDPYGFIDIALSFNRSIPPVYIRTFRDMPNPFVNPQSFLANRGLTNQILSQNESSKPILEQKQPDDDNLLNEKESKLPGNPFFNPTHFEKIKTHRRNGWTALFQAVNDISILAVIKHLDGIGDQDRMHNKYKVKGDNVLVNGQQWYNANADEGGVGPVSLFQAFSDFDRRDQAIIELSKIFKNQLGTDEIRAQASSASRPKPVFEAPENAPEFLDEIRNYLHNKRGISKDLIERLIQEGRLYSDVYKNVVMISKTGQIAELRGTEPYKDKFTDTWEYIKMLKPGSDKDSGAFLIAPDPAKIADGSLKSEKIFAFVEAGIDAMSYHMLNPGKVVVSASGAAFSYPKKIFFECYANGYGFRCAFDADLAGSKASQNIYNSAALFHIFSQKHGIATPAEFMNLFQSKTLRFKLRPEEFKSANTSQTASQEEDHDDDLTENVLFFNSEDPFSNPDNPPKIKYQIRPNSLGIPTGHQEVIITPEMHNQILEKFKLKRDTPTDAKDWNDMVKPKSNNMPKYS